MSACPHTNNLIKINVVKGLLVTTSSASGDIRSGSFVQLATQRHKTLSRTSSMSSGSNIVLDSVSGLVHNDRSPAELLQLYPDGAYTTIAMLGDKVRDLSLHVERIERYTVYVVAVGSCRKRACSHSACNVLFRCRNIATLMDRGHFKEASELAEVRTHLLVSALSSAYYSQSCTQLQLYYGFSPSCHVLSSRNTSPPVPTHFKLTHTPVLNACPDTQWRHPCTHECGAQNAHHSPGTSWPDTCSSLQKQGGTPSKIFREDLALLLSSAKEHFGYSKVRDQVLYGCNTCMW